MPLVTVKTKYQVTIPQEVREALGIGEGDLLEARVEGDRIVLIPKEVVDRREAAFRRLDALTERVRARWEGEGRTEAEMQRLVEAAVEAARAERRGDAPDES